MNRAESGEGESDYRAIYLILAIGQIAILTLFESGSESKSGSLGLTLFESNRAYLQESGTTFESDLNKHATYFPCEAAAGVRFKENNFVRFDAEVRFKNPSKLSGVRFKYKLDNIRLGAPPGELDNRTIGRPIVRFTNKRPDHKFC